MSVSLRAAIALAMFIGVQSSFTAQPPAPDADVQRDVHTFYERRGHHVAWLDPERRPTSAAWVMIGRFSAAADEGLARDDYEADQLEAEARASTGTAADAAAFDVRLTRNAVQYMRHLHLGRVNPRSLGFHLDHPTSPHDFPALLQRALDADTLEHVIAELRPPLVQYRELRRALRTYRGRDPARARTIELAMERLRWLPDMAGERLVVVNIPMFYAWAWEADRAEGVPAIEMAAIIGRAGASRTPVFTASITSLVINPSWHVPDSIARNEILPKLRGDPAYLSRNHMEISSSAAGPRIRQLPGPWNALGSLKFDLPNLHGVYLHGAPAAELFARPRRDFSHGCIRLENPVALAEWMLAGQGEWDGASILAAIATGQTRVVEISRRPRVVIFYMTAAFTPVEQTVRFADDIYGHDARLDAWLKARTGDGE